MNAPLRPTTFKAGDATEPRAGSPAGHPGSTLSMAWLPYVGSVQALDASTNAGPASESAASASAALVVPPGVLCPPMHACQTTLGGFRIVGVGARAPDAHERDRRVREEQRGLVCVGPGQLTVFE